MNDRYLFRAKRTDNSEWVEGFLFQLCYDSTFCWCIGNEPLSPNDYSELYGFNREWFYIDESTICQCTGLKDKNGNLIWENDIILINTYSYEEPEDTVVGVVKYSEANTGFCLDDGDAWIPINEIYGSYTTEYFVEGNIFDNAELMEQEG